MRKSGFTLMEVIISCTILALFMLGVMTLFTSGGKASNATMWLQNTTNRLKLAARQINTSITKSSYPAVIEYPNGITQNTNTDFDIHYLSSVSAGSNQDFLVITEAIPAQTGKGANVVASISYHVFSIDNTDLIYTLYEHNPAPDFATVKTLSKDIIGSSQKYRTKLVYDIASITCEVIKNSTETDSTNNKLLKVSMTCRMPKFKTERTEVAIGVPNVNLIDDSVPLPPGS